MMYSDFYKDSIDNPESFWLSKAKDLAWHKEPTTILSKDKHNYNQWFENGTLNLSYLCIDKHINDGYGDQNAIIYDSPVTNTIEHITFNQLHYQVSKLQEVYKI